jgi:hypothetical protein
MLQNTHPLNLPGLSMDIGLFEFLCISLSDPRNQRIQPRHNIVYITHLEREHIVREDYHFVPPVLVVLDKELTRLELSWIHAIKQHTFT